MQVVGIKGHNPSRHCLIALELVDSIPLSIAADTNMPPAKKQSLDEEIQATNLLSTPTEITMIIAAGPFTTTDSLLFEPLTELLTYATRKRPQFLILVQDYLEYMGSDAWVVIVPFVQDANHNFVFPQVFFFLLLILIQQPVGIKHQITSITNPGIFEADEVKIGCCTVDILKHLSGELSRHSMDGTPRDRLSRLARHILSQRSFYPLYPPAEGVPLDFSLAPEALNISAVPDLLILPSDFKYFVKVSGDATMPNYFSVPTSISNSNKKKIWLQDAIIKVVSLGGTREGEEQMKKFCCINPGRLAKGEGGGTFVELKYQGSPDKMNVSIIGI
ncbi:hypothetical protein CRYUN_Cryun04dG0158500 [Craigia yunnanensis]